ncbi:MAG TPA: pyruvate dehydrogenase (acetyl-transferring) E1 component subunit alpha [Phycisphaerae bacterium]|nr:pyruvate dehydrogenase (acetyl-transferring) E1 component subunit alpha [Phycisphaerae bacterium]
MPREPLKIPFRVDGLSILNFNGEVDQALEPALPPDDLRRLYRTMLASRRFDERCLQLQRQGRMGTYGPSKGQEAASLGAAYVLQPRDWMCPSFRETAGMLWRGWPMSQIMHYWAGCELGNIAPEQVNDLPICVPIASQCQYGMGIAWGCKLKGEGAVCLTFCGDGATSEGDFHEAMNFAGVFNLPLIMLVQNNHWAISIPRERQTISQTIAQKAIAYGVPGLQVDGNDLLAVIVGVREAVERARTGGGPTLIEAVTYRLGVHTTADDPKKYRTDEQVKEWEARDPLPRLRRYLIEKGLLDDKAEQEFEQSIAAELEQAASEYQQVKRDPAEFFDYMYACQTPELQREQTELRAYLQSQAEPEPAEKPVRQPRPGPQASGHVSGDGNHAPKGDGRLAGGQRLVESRCNLRQSIL